MTFIKSLLPAVALLLILTPPASATPLAAGTSCIVGVDCGSPGPNFTPDSVGTLLNTVTRKVTGVNSAKVVRFTGQLKSAVYQEASGYLTFYYQYYADLGSATAVDGFSMTDFAGYTVNAGYRTDNLGGGFFSTGSKTPRELSLDVTGSVVGFDYKSPNFGVLSGGTISNIMVIKTNAKSYTTGSTQIIDGGVDTVSTFAPVPEPGFYGVLSVGLAGLALAIRRHAEKA